MYISLTEGKKPVYQVCYKNYLGKWTKDKTKTTNKTRADNIKEKIAKTKAENGVATVQIVGYK